MESLKEVAASLDKIIDNAETAMKGGASADGAKEDAAAAPVAASNGTAAAGDGVEVQKQKPKQKKKKKGPAPMEKVDPAVAQFLMCDLRVGRITTVGHHPESEKLFALKVAYGEGEAERSVCAGLRGFVTDEELQGRHVVTIINLKPRVLKGVKSEAMILAGSVKGEGEEAAKERVVPLNAPEGAAAGDIVGVEGLAGERAVTDESGAMKYVSSKNWERVVGRLAVKGEVATYNGANILVGTKAVQCALPDGAEIH